MKSFALIITFACTLIHASDEFKNPAQKMQDRKAEELKKEADYALQQAQQNRTPVVLGAGVTQSQMWQAQQHNFEMWKQQHPHNLGGGPFGNKK